MHPLSRVRLKRKLECPKKFRFRTFNKRCCLWCLMMEYHLTAGFAISYSLLDTSGLLNCNGSDFPFPFAAGSGLLKSQPFVTEAFMSENEHPFLAVSPRSSSSTLKSKTFLLHWKNPIFPSSLHRLGSPCQAMGIFRFICLTECMHSSNSCIINRFLSSHLNIASPWLNFLAHLEKPLASCQMSNLSFQPTIGSHNGHKTPQHRHHQRQIRNKIRKGKQSVFRPSLRTST